ncbi:hypothetical protein [Endozoicomonas elysicola]|nr:hypothetical protein [Endozoicomonas elysicola]
MDLPEVSPQLPPNETAESGVKNAPSLSERSSEVRSNISSKLNPDKTPEYQNSLKGIDSNSTASKRINTVRENISSSFSMSIQDVTVGESSTDNNPDQIKSLKGVGTQAATLSRAENSSQPPKMSKLQEAPQSNSQVQTKREVRFARTEANTAGKISTKSVDKQKVKLDKQALQPNMPVKKASNERKVSDSSALATGAKKAGTATLAGLAGTVGFIAGIAAAPFKGFIDAVGSGQESDKRQKEKNKHHESDGGLPAVLISLPIHIIKNFAALPAAMAIRASTATNHSLSGDQSVSKAEKWAKDFMAMPDVSDD